MKSFRTILITIDSNWMNELSVSPYFTKAALPLKFFSKWSWHIGILMMIVDCVAQYPFILVFSFKQLWFLYFDAPKAICLSKENRNKTFTTKTVVKFRLNTIAPLLWRLHVKPRSFLYVSCLYFRLSSYHQSGVMIWIRLPCKPGLVPQISRKSLLSVVMKSKCGRVVAWGQRKLCFDGVYIVSIMLALALSLVWCYNYKYESFSRRRTMKFKTSNSLSWTNDWNRKKSFDQKHSEIKIFKMTLVEHKLLQHGRANILMVHRKRGKSHRRPRQGIRTEYH